MSEPQFVVLKGGPVLPLAPVMLALRLEALGFRFRLDADDNLEVAPFDQLATDDREALRRWRYHIAVLMAYEGDAYVPRDDGKAPLKRSAARDDGRAEERR